MIEYGGAVNSTTSSGGNDVPTELLAWAPYVAFPTLALIAVAAFLLFGSRRR